MHANRPFLLGNLSSQGETASVRDSIFECISAAKGVLETVDAMAKDGTIFHAMWWAHYVTFCALAVVYVWEIQQSTNRNEASKDQSLVKVFELAERCHSHLARATAADSLSRRYSVILEELRSEAKLQAAKSIVTSVQVEDNGTAADGDKGPGGAQQIRPFDSLENSGLEQVFPSQGEMHFYGMNNLLNEWQTTDWLDLDSSVGLLKRSPE